jgi:hypothetical protein
VSCYCVKNVISIFKYLQLDKANEMQNSYFKVLMPSVFQGLQDVDQRRVKCMKLNMRQATEMECRVYPIINKCLEGILRAADEIDDETVSEYITMYLI